MRVRPTHIAFVAVVLSAAWKPSAAQDERPTGHAQAPTEADRQEAHRRSELLRQPAALSAALDEGLDPNERLGGLPPLLYDAMLATDAPFESTRLLLAHGADPNWADASGRTPLMIAANQGDAQRVEALLDAGAAVEASDAAGRTALFWAVGWTQHANDGRAMLLLLDAGADAKRLSASGDQPVHFAADSGTVAARAFIVRAKALGLDLNARDAKGRTPLLRAVLSGDLRSRMTEGEDDGKRLFGALMLVLMCSDASRTVEALLSAGADVEATDSDGNTALMLAASAGDLAALEVKMGGSAEEARRLRRRGEGAPAQSRSQHVQTTELLLWRGADPTRRNKADDSAIDIAARRLDRDRDRLVSTLQDAAKEPWPPIVSE